jgi:hypothetical protein
MMISESAEGGFYHLTNQEAELKKEPREIIFTSNSPFALDNFVHCSLIDDLHNIFVVVLCFVSHRITVVLAVPIYFPLLLI